MPPDFDRKDLGAVGLLNFIAHLAAGAVFVCDYGQLAQLTRDAELEHD